MDLRAAAAPMIMAWLLLSGSAAMARDRGPAQSDPTRAALEKALMAYEDVRALLAADATEGVRQAAIRMRAAARRAAAAAPESRRAPIDALRQSAVQLQRSAESRDGLELLRWAFGEVSRAVIALLGAE